MALFRLAQKSTRNTFGMEWDHFNLSNILAGNVSKRQFGEFLSTPGNLSKTIEKKNCHGCIGHRMASSRVHIHTCNIAHKTPEQNP